MLSKMQIRNRQSRDAGLEFPDYQTQLRLFDTVEIVEVSQSPLEANRYVGFVLSTDDHGWYLLVECELEQGGRRQFQVWRDCPPAYGVVGIKVLRRVCHEPEKEAAPLYSKRGLVRPTARPRAEEVLPGRQYRAKVNGYYTIISIIEREGTGWKAIDIQTRREVHVDSAGQLRKLESCPGCHRLVYDLPKVGWPPCLACQIEQGVINGYPQLD